MNTKYLQNRILANMDTALGSKTKLKLNEIPLSCFIQMMGKINRAWYPSYTRVFGVVYRLSQTPLKKKEIEWLR